MAATAEAATYGGHASKRPGILIAIEPRSYREAIGDAVQTLRPHLEVTVVDPANLMVEIMRRDPVLVICGQPEAPRAGCGRSGWFEYRPYERPEARINIEGEYSEMEDVDLDDILSVVDECAAIVDAGY